MPKLKTILVGFGNIAEEMAHDSIKAKSTAYATHAQVLRDHPDFDWVAVVDPSAEKRECAKSRWGVNTVVPDLQSLPISLQPDLAVIATTPAYRAPVIEQLPALKGVLVEKPLGKDIKSAREFSTLCQKRNIKAQINFWRRGDSTSRALADGGLKSRIGRPQTAFGVYGNGFRNNAVHMIDYTRMLLGEVSCAQALGTPRAAAGLPIADDVLVPFSLTLENGALVTFHSLDFGFYRENSLEIWGEKGCVSILQEGWRLLSHSLHQHGTLGGAREVDFDQAERLKSGAGHAFYDMYDNLANAVKGNSSLWSSAGSALRNEEILEAVLCSAENEFKPTLLSI